jgi:hypothetical protein
MRTDVYVVRESISRIVAMLTARKLKVTQRGTQAKVAYHKVTGEIMEVNIPFIPDDASPEFIAAVQGFLDHEVGHVLHTDPEVVKAAHKAGRRVANLANLIEDVYVERKMTETFRGSGANLDVLRNFFFDKMIGAQIEKDLKEGNVEAAQGGAMVIAFRAWGGQKLAQDFLKRPGMAELVQPIADKLGKDLIEQIGKCNSSADCLELAKKVKKAFEKTKPPAPPPVAPPMPTPPEPEDEGDGKEPGDPSEEGGKGSPEESGAGESDDEGTPHPEDKGEAKEEPEAGDDAEGESSPGAEPAPEPEDTEPEHTEPEEERETEPEPPKSPEGEGDEAGAGDDDEGEGAGEGAGTDEGSGEQDEDERTEPESAEGEGDGGGDSDDHEAGGAGEASSEPEPESAEDDDEAAGGEDAGGEGSGSSATDDDEAAETEEDTTGGGGSSEESPAETPEGPGAEPEVVENEMPDLGALADKNHDFDREASEALTKLAINEMSESDYATFTNEFDVIEPAPECGNPDSVRLLMEEVQGQTAVMAKYLERAMAAQARKMWNPGLRRGRINPGSLFRTSVGDDRVFRQRFETKAKNTAVQLIVDCSGSMSMGRKIHTAGTAAYALSHTLERIKVANEVIGFTTFYYGDEICEKYHAAYNEEVSRSGLSIDYSRLMPLRLPVFKAFNERLDASTRSRLAHLREHPDWLAENCDGESILMAAQRLMAQNVERRVVIVLSDGRPACPPAIGLERHLREAIQKLEKNGVEVIGIGIGTDVVKHFYPKHVVLHDVRELSTTLIGQLTKLLLD